MENIHTPHIMYADKIPSDEHEHDHEEEGTLTLLNTASYETKGRLEPVPCCKYDRVVTTTKNRSYESEKGRETEKPVP